MGGGGSNNVPESFDRAASTKRANLVRDQWNDYKQRFQPVENKIIGAMGQGDNTQFNDQGIATAGQSAETAFAAARAMENRDQSRFGLELTPEQQQLKTVQYGVEKSMAKANATNTARQWDIDRRNAAMSGGVGNAASLGRS